MSAQKRTLASLSEMLFEEIESLRSGSTDVGRAKAVSALAAQLLKAAEVGIAFREQSVRLTGKSAPAMNEIELSPAVDSVPGPKTQEAAAAKINPNPPRLGAPRYVKGSSYQ